MPLFHYKALDPKGRESIGVINADSIESAKSALKKQQLFVTKLFLKDRFAKRSYLTTNQLLSFCKELYQLQKAGVPLYDSLLTIEEKYQGHKSHPLFLDLSDQVKQGKLLSTALANYPKTFDAVFCSMVAAGENTGDLAHVLLELSKILARESKLKGQLRSALTYPAFLASFSCFVLISLLFFIIPSMSELLEGRRLSAITEMVLSTSRFLTSHQNLFFGSLILFVVSGFLALRSQRVIRQIKKWAIHIPLVKTLIQQGVLMRFCRVLSSLVGSSIPLVEALRLARSVMYHPDYEQVILQAEKSLAEGKKFSDQLKASRLIPPLVVRMIATSEQAGGTSEMLMNISEIYEEELEKSLKQLTSLLQPVLLIVMGIIIGVILLSVLLPMTDVSSFN